MKKATKLKTCCHWCNVPLVMKPGFDEKKHKPICSPGCRDAERLFCLFYSDEEIEMRERYEDDANET